ncbi:hypothetical protein RYZ27_05320 [Hyphomonas sp. FCG-A18]|uniref:hypothetical protein n=1 Tax=Hyphomonas sp. FCG-A18 TaxID=3080019 RepID=UPI002B2F69E3|nr:hypothetical protein RYZ27_05320 [Hyphomonas sp. FCG-A18]
MATTSMWNDELYSIRYFSQQGLYTAWTDYHEPNNHILFNMLASVIPSGLAYSPFWARIISFIAVLGALFFFLRFSFKEGFFAGGVLAVGLLFLNTDTLDLTLQARGYGIVFAAAITQSIFLYYFLKNGDAGSRNGLFISAFVGGATLPIYIPFAAIQCGLAFLLRPSWRFAFAGMVTGLAGIAFYLPTATQILGAASGYAKNWGTHYATMESVWETLEYILVENVSPIYLIYASLALGLIALLLKGWSYQLKMVLICLVAYIGFTAVCLYLQTPLVRTTQFIVAPLAVGGAVLVSQLFRYEWGATIQTLVISAALAVIGYNGVQKIRNWHFVPIEAWSQVARFSEAVAPDQVKFYAPFRNWQLGVHLDDPGRLRTELNETAFRSGQMLAIDANFQDGVFFSGKAITDEALEFDLSQRRGGAVRLAFVPVRTGALETISVENLRQDNVALAMDKQPDTRWTNGQHQTELPSQSTVRFKLLKERSCVKLFWYGKNGDMPQVYKVSAELRDGRRVSADHRSSRLGRDLLMLDLSGLEVESVAFDIKPGKAKRYLSINEAWCGY